MSSIKAKIVGFSFIGFCLFSLILILIILTFEITGLSKKISANYNFYQNFDTGKLLIIADYYQPTIHDDPYKNFLTQHLHPYYLFSLPWRSNDIDNANNDVVRINNNGFRINPFENSKNKSILLGGSTAFGHFSSSDKETIAYNISKKLDIHIINRNAPSWNSHQELVALTKMEPIYKFSISLSLANDIEIACEIYQGSLDDRYPDQPESFNILAKYFNDLRGEALYKEKKGIILLKKIKQTLRQKFPDSYFLAYLIKRHLLNKNQEIYPNSEINYCNNYSANSIANSYLKNQEAMSRISKSKDGKHYLILQPQYELVNTVNTKKALFKRKVYDIVMESQYCKSNPCLDLTQTDLSRIGTNILFDGNNFNTAIFADNVHLLDNGVRFYSNLISDFISSSR